MSRLLNRVLSRLNLDSKDKADFVKGIKELNNSNNSNTIIEDNTIQTAQAGVCYILNKQGDIKITSLESPSGNESKYEFRFNGATSLTIPSNVIWLNGESPELDSTANYELSIVATKAGEDYVYKAVLGKFIQS